MSPELEREKRQVLETLRRHEQAMRRVRNRPIPNYTNDPIANWIIDKVVAVVGLLLLGLAFIGFMVLSTCNQHPAQSLSNSSAQLGYQAADTPQRGRDKCYAMYPRASCDAVKL